MAIQDIQITVLINNIPSHRMTSELEPLLKAIAIGESGDMITFSKVVGGILAIGGKLQITGGTENDHAIIKSQLDGVVSSLGGAIGALAGRMDTVEGRLDTAEGDILTLQADVNAIYNNTPKDNRFIATAGQTIFAITGFTFDASNLVQDIEVWIDGRRETQSLLGDFTDGAWRKNSTSEIETAEGVPAGKELIVWKQGTSSGSGGGGAGAVAVLDEGVAVEPSATIFDFVGPGVLVDRPSPGRARVTIPGGGSGSDLENITVDITPAEAGANSVGTLAKPWSSVIIKDTDNDDVWELKVSSGVFSAVKLT
jgi:hypothetical protein